MARDSDYFSVGGHQICGLLACLFLEEKLRERGRGLIILVASIFRRRDVEVTWLKGDTGCVDVIRLKSLERTVGCECIRWDSLS